ncbi:TLD domain-containing protein [Ditylenchus destructor]|uniref:TLD domain-containing protein n=1 Tax=Ditylenchus destructor TaxID=166010 RepID=A0AAD4R8D0_9BILA|nr:TLD domain-containing protein [Ditylenchus destructor]
MVLGTSSTSADVLNVISSASPANSTFHLAPPQSTSTQKQESNSSAGASEDRRSVLKSSAFTSLFQLSEEYSNMPDRLDKNQLEEDNWSRRRRHSVVDPNSGSNDGYSPERSLLDRRKSVAYFDYKDNLIDTNDSNAPSTKGQSQIITSNTNKHDGHNDEVVESQNPSCENSKSPGGVMRHDSLLLPNRLKRGSIPTIAVINNQKEDSLSVCEGADQLQQWDNSDDLADPQRKENTPTVVVAAQAALSHIRAGESEYSSFSQPHSSTDHNHNSVFRSASNPIRFPPKGILTTRRLEEKDSETLSPEEESLMMLKRKNSGRCMSAAFLSTHARGHTTARRRSSVTFRDVIIEENNEDLLKSDNQTITRIGSIEEDDTENKRNGEHYYENHEYHSEGVLTGEESGDQEILKNSDNNPPKRRSMSLYPGLDNPAYTSALRLRTLGESIDEANGCHSKDSGNVLDILPKSCNKSRKSKRAALGMFGLPGGAHLAGLRSDSVDSGFSCASISSCSSTESSIDDGPVGSLSVPNRQRSMSIQPGSSAALPDFKTDYPTWLRSVKKLVQLVEEMKHEVDENKENISTLDMLAAQYKQDVENVKKFVRHNDWPVSHEIRTDLWRVLCHSKDFESNKALYTQQLEDLTKSGVKNLRPSFLSMDGIVVHDHGLKQEGAVTLQRLLIVIECVRPEIRYVPMLYPLCAMFLHYLSAEETFACVMRLLSTSQGTYILQSELSVFASCHTLLSLLKKHKKSVYTCLKRRAGTNDDLKLAEIFSDWNAWIFKYLPFEYLVRVMDCFLVEGHKMLLRVTLSLVYLWYKHITKDQSSAAEQVATPAVGQRRHFPLMRSSTLPSRPKPSSAGQPTNNDASGKSVDEKISEINHQIIEMTQNCPVSMQTLLDMGFGIRNFKHSTFEQRQKHYENKFRDEVARRRADKQGHGVRPQRCIYTAAFESTIIDSTAANELIAALPSRFQLETPQLLFRLSEHGASFVQLWTQIDDADQTLFVIRTTSGEVFGAYCSSCWVERRDVRERSKTRYFGTGESFVWSLHPELQLPVIYGWSGQHSDHPDTCPQMFMTAGDRYLIIGSGGGDAIAIRDELTRGLSYPCDTFASPALVSSNEFGIDELEVYMVFSK